MPNYPNEFYDPREKENWPGIEFDPAKKTLTFKEDFDSLENEILAIEAELGLNFRDESGNIDLKTKKIVNLANPVVNHDAAPKVYVDNRVISSGENKLYRGRHWKKGDINSVPFNLDLIEVFGPSGIEQPEGGCLVRCFLCHYNGTMACEEKWSAAIYKHPNDTWTKNVSARVESAKIGTPIASSLAWVEIDPEHYRLRLTANHLYAEVYVEIIYNVYEERGIWTLL